MSYGYGKKARQEAFDNLQARLRTQEQNETIIDLIQKNGAQDAWSYSTIKATGDPVTLQKIGFKNWVIAADGTYTEQPYPTGGPGL